MKKAVLVTLLVLLLAALLTSCSGPPEALNQYWRENLTSEKTSNEFKEILRPAIYCLIPIITFAALYAASKPKSKHLTTFVVLLVCVAIVPLTAPLSSLIIDELFIPKDLTLPNVMERMGWTFPLPEGDLNPSTLFAALNFTFVMLPIITKIWHYFILFTLVLLLFASVIAKSLRPLTVWLAMALGYALFFVGYNMVTLGFEEARPEGAIVGRVVATIGQFNFVYIGTIPALFCITGLVIPVVGFILAEMVRHQVEPEASTPGEDVKKILAYIAGSAAARTPQEDAEESSEASDIIEGDFRVDDSKPTPLLPGPSDSKEGLNGKRPPQPTDGDDVVSPHDRVNLDEGDDDESVEGEFSTDSNLPRVGQSEKPEEEDRLEIPDTDSIKEAPEGDESEMAEDDRLEVSADSNQIPKTDVTDENGQHSLDVSAIQSGVDQKHEDSNTARVVSDDSLKNLYAGFTPDALDRDLGVKEERPGSDRLELKEETASPKHRWVTPKGRQTPEVSEYLPKEITELPELPEEPEDPLITNPQGGEDDS